MIGRILSTRTLRVNKLRFASTTSPSLEWENDFKTVSKAERTDITSDYLVKALSSRVYEIAVETKASYAPTLSNLIKNDVYLKREDTQPVFSFKIRGAGNKIACLSPEQIEKGVVTCSAGNHAQGVAMAAHKLGINATIVMPETAPQIKVDAVKRFGGSHAKVLLHGGNFDEAAAEAKRLVVEQGLTMVHPFDDPLVIAGQATIGMEILKVKHSPAYLFGLFRTDCAYLFVLLNMQLNFCVILHHYRSHIPGSAEQAAAQCVRVLRRRWYVGGHRGVY